MTVYLLPEEPVFPDAREAEPDGLIAIGGDLNPERLLQAYSGGIFPWFIEAGEVYWFSPDPRLIMYPNQFRISDSMKRTIRTGRFEVKFDTAFEAVINRCAEAPRPGQEGTWINADFINAYISLYKHGFAHSVEVYQNQALVGGLYGVSLGTAFFGESMFHRVKDASKVAFHALTERCKSYNFNFIDCQVESQHLISLGASLTARNDYLKMLELALKGKTFRGSWHQ